MADQEKEADAPVAEPVQSIETENVDGDGAKKDEEAAEGSDHDATGEPEDDTAEVADGKISNDLYKAFKAITEELLNFKVKVKSNEEYYPSSLFKRLPNKRLIPEYYEVIKEPSAISTLRGKIQRKQYSGVPEFVRDFALVVHNAQVFNRSNSQPVRDVLKLDEIFKAGLQKLVEEGYASEEEIKYPELGEIPYSTPEPDPVSEEDEAEDDEDDEDEEADDSDDDKRRKRGRRGKSGAGKKGDEEEDDDKAADAEQKRRGRPPKVATPMEHRIDRILKSLRKPRAQDGTQMLLPFERLPDKTEVPEYYQVITNPIAFDILKKKAKRKKYSSIEEFMRDVELMFNNAMHFNEEGSDIHKWAQELLAEAKRVEIEERARPDSEYLQAAEGRIPLPHIVHKGDIWKVGDWVHIQNPNDITKPIVAQIYRTWKTANDEEWINACWYYRPEQTVHQYEKHFFPNEVVKTGQYRDHKIEEVLNKCFVMFYTRYSRGRPRNLPPNTEVYVCEARYNEVQHKFNKIKTWASCLPDEVRDKDYEMDLYDAPRKIKKVPSPLLHLLKDDAKESDELPQPEWKHPNAPPVVGGIHKQSRHPQQSPPPEPTPPPQPAATPVPVARTPSINHQNPIALGRTSLERQASSSLNNQIQMTRTPAMTPQASFTGHSNQYTARQQQSYAGATHPYASGTPSLPQQLSQQLPYAAQPVQPAPVGGHPSAFGTASSTQNYNRPAPVAVPPAQYNAYQTNASITQRTAETYVLPEAANESIPLGIREQFPRDDQGRVLFFTQPPLNTEHIVCGSSKSEQGRPLQHTDEHMRALALRKRKRGEMQENEQEDKRVNGTESGPATKQTKSTEARPDKEELSREEITARTVGMMTEQIKKGMIDDYKAQEGPHWSHALTADLKRGEERLAREMEKARQAAAKRAAFNSAHSGKHQARFGPYGLNAQGYITGWQKNFFTGTYLDDLDSRLP